MNGKPGDNGAVTVKDEGQEAGTISQTVTVDGITGYEWVTVGKNNTTSFGIEPRIGDEETMVNTIMRIKDIENLLLHSMEMGRLGLLQNF